MSSQRGPVVLIGIDAADVTVVEQLISAGQLRADCGDLLFTTQDGTPLKYWLDPIPGCSAPNSVVWLQLLSSDDVRMFHGSADAAPEGRQATPKDLVAWFEDFEYDGINALVVPPGTPEPVLQRLRTALRKAVESEAHTRFALDAGNKAVYTDGTVFRDVLQRDYDRWGRLIREAGGLKQ